MTSTQKIVFDQLHMCSIRNRRVPTAPEKGQLEPRVWVDHITQSGFEFFGRDVLGIEPSWTSGSTGTAMSGRALVGKQPLHRLIDFAASERGSYQKGCRKQQGWKPAKSRSFLQRFGRSQRNPF